MSGAAAMMPLSRLLRRRTRRRSSVRRTPPGVDASVRAPVVRRRRSARGASWRVRRRTVRNLDRHRRAGVALHGRLDVEPMIGAIQLLEPAPGVFEAHTRRAAAGVDEPGSVIGNRDRLSRIRSKMKILRVSPVAIAVYVVLIGVAPFAGILLYPRTPHLAAYGATALILSLAVCVMLLARRAALRRARLEPPTA
jgi:hypothetical protein